MKVSRVHERLALTSCRLFIAAPPLYRGAPPPPPPPPPAADPVDVFRAANYDNSYTFLAISRVSLLNNRVSRDSAGRIGTHSFARGDSRADNAARREMIYERCALTARPKLIRVYIALICPRYLAGRSTASSCIKARDARPRPREESPRGRKNID